MGGGSIFLMMNHSTHKNIIIEDLELYLPPSKQIEIINLFVQVGSDNQLMITTYEPQLIANTPYENIIILNNVSGKIGKIQAAYATPITLAGIYATITTEIKNR